MLRTGQVIARRYQVVKHLGSGGMAEVYKVWDRARAVHLAMKLLKPAFTESDDFITLFQLEAQHLKDLSHPHIVRFYEFGWDRNNAFFVMDCVEGNTLRKEIEAAGGPLPIARIQKILQSICPALHYAHSRKVIHCDLKPANILVDSMGEPFISDFGIAQVAHSAEGHRHLDTLSGAGTPAYMAPEQISDNRIGLATDIYALGVILFEMLTGRKPFLGKYAPQSISSEREKIAWEKDHLSPPPPSKVNPSSPVTIDSIVQKCLIRDPDRRYANVLDIQNDFENAVNLISPGNKEFNEVRNASRSQERIDFLDDSSNRRKEAKSFTQEFKIQLLLGGISIAVIVGLFLLTTGTNPPGDRITPQGQKAPVASEQTYDYQSICMEIPIPNQPRTTLEECVDKITVLPDGMLKVHFNWAVTSVSSTFGVQIADDSDNFNMYLTDDLNNRLDHIETGGGANETVSLFNGQSKQGWFLFPAPESNAKYFVFHDDDNGTYSPPMRRQW